MVKSFLKQKAENWLQKEGRVGQLITLFVFVLTFSLMINPLLDWFHNQEIEHQKHMNRVRKVIWGACEMTVNNPKATDEQIRACFEMYSDSYGW